MSKMAIVLDKIVDNCINDNASGRGVYQNLYVCTLRINNPFLKCPYLGNEIKGKYFVSNQCLYVRRN